MIAKRKVPQEQYVDKMTIIFLNESLRANVWGRIVPVMAYPRFLKGELILLAM